MSNPAMNMVPAQTPLARVFWLYGVIPSNLLWAATLYLIRADAAAGIVTVALLVLLLYTAWILTAVWRCADNVRESARWGVVARWLTVAWAINTVMVVGFLLLDMLA